MPGDQVVFVRALTVVRVANNLIPLRKIAACRTPILLMMVAAVILSSCAPSPRWWKGNLHTHSYWSDGDDYPEMIVDWYRSNGYDFVALSDHNVLAQDEVWIDLSKIPGSRSVHERYVRRFGDEWVSERIQGGDTLVRLKTYSEYRTLFDVEGSFLTIQAEEISDNFDGKSIHVNATNIDSLILPQGGSSVREVMQNNIDAVLDRRRRTGRPIMPHVNHPNYRWSVAAEDLAALEGERFFEVYNGHPLVNNEGDSLHPSTEAMWDAVLSSRLRADREMMYGLAVDDAHNYREEDSTRANPGRGWIMVRSTELSPSAIIAALERGDFYSTTGVTINEIEWDGTTLEIDIAPVEGVEYETIFLGATADAPDETGIIFSLVRGTSPAYEADGSELYVRARVQSSKSKSNPVFAGEMETAWTQPVQPRNSNTTARR